MPDLLATIDQTTVDKLVAATSFPLTLFVHDEPFPKLLLQDDPGQADVPIETIIDIVKKIEQATESSAKAQDPIERELITQIAAAERALFDAARRVIPAQTDPTYDAGKAEAIRKFIAGGLEELKPGLQERGWPRWKVHLRYARVRVLEAPTLRIGVPNTTAADFRAEVLVTGELWFYGPRPTWDWPWNWPIEWQRWASATVRPTITGRGYVALQTDGHLVMGKGVVQDLRIQVPILNLINLAGVANGQLAKQRKVVYDTRKLVVAIPLIGETFHVASIRLPEGTGRITVEVNVAKI